jgi:hypothetical protein
MLDTALSLGFCKEITYFIIAKYYIQKQTNYDFIFAQALIFYLIRAK